MFAVKTRQMLSDGIAFLVVVWWLRDVCGGGWGAILPDLGQDRHLALQSLQSVVCCWHPVRAHPEAASEKFNGVRLGSIRLRAGAG